MDDAGLPLTVEPSLDEDSRGLDFSGMLILIWRRKWFVIASIVLAFGFGVIYLHYAPKTYATEMKVTAATSSGNSIANRLGNLGGLAAAAGLPIGGSSKAEPFDLYLEALTSRGVADRLAKDKRVMTTIFAREWDRKRGVWRMPPPTLGERIRLLLGLGRQPWHVPDGPRLRQYLQREIVITKNAKSPITVVGYDARDPDFGVYLLQQMNLGADDQVRVGALEQATEYQAYLTSVLPTVVLAEVRRSLADSLSRQYESVMMAKSSVAYAALSLDGPQASVEPTKPKITIVLIVSILLGAIIGLAGALVDFRGMLRREKRPISEID